MVFGNNIQGQHPVDWAEEPGLRIAKPEFREEQPRPGGAPEAQTPQEALTHIDLLYKSGRMGELAALMRRSEVFREAWRLVQQSSLAGLGTRDGKITTGPNAGQGSGAFPVPQARSPGPSARPESPPGGSGSSAMTVSGPDAGAAKRARPAGNLSPPQNDAAFEAYRKMAGDWAQKHKAAQRISIRV